MFYSFSLSFMPILFGFLSFPSLPLRAIGWMTEKLGFDSLKGQEVFHSSTASRLAMGLTQPPIQWVIEAPSVEVKQQGHEADHSPPSSPNITNGGGIPPLPIHLHGMVLN
jgi:hypothetical protein